MYNFYDFEKENDTYSELHVNRNTLVVIYKTFCNATEQLKIDRESTDTPTLKDLLVNTSMLSCGKIADEMRKMIEAMDKNEEKLIKTVSQKKEE